MLRIDEVGILPVPRDEGGDDGTEHGDAPAALSDVVERVGDDTILLLVPAARSSPARTGSGTGL
jgi:hypothetical protein